MSNNDDNQRHFGMSTDLVSCDDGVHCPECGQRAWTAARGVIISWSTPFVVVSTNARRRRELPGRVRKMDSAQVCERVPTVSASTVFDDVRSPDNRISERLATTSYSDNRIRDQLATTPSSAAITECRAGRSMTRDAATISERFAGGQHMEQGPRSTTKAGDGRQLAPGATAASAVAIAASRPSRRRSSSSIASRRYGAQPEDHTECVGGEPEDSAAGGVSPWPAGYKPR